MLGTDFEYSGLTSLRRPSVLCLLSRVLVPFDLPSLVVRTDMSITTHDFRRWCGGQTQESQPPLCL